MQILRRSTMIRVLSSSFLPVVLCLSLYAGETSELSRGQKVYVPAYSHIYSGANAKPFLLTVTLSIRNIDPNERIRVTRADYYETQGRLVKQFIDKPINMNPLGTTRFVVPEQSEAGGSGANFIVEWESDSTVNQPIVESIMIGTKSSQGVSFTSRGQAILPTGND